MGSHFWCHAAGSVLPAYGHPVALPCISWLAEDRGDSLWRRFTCPVILGEWYQHPDQAMEGHTFPDQPSGQCGTLPAAGGGLQVPRGTWTLDGRWDVDAKADQRGPNVWCASFCWTYWRQRADGSFDIVPVFRSDWCWPLEEHLCGVFWESSATRYWLA